MERCPECSWTWAIPVVFSCSSATIPCIRQLQISVAPSQVIEVAIVELDDLDVLVSMYHIEDLVHGGQAVAQNRRPRDSCLICILEGSFAFASGKACHLRNEGLTFCLRRNEPHSLIEGALALSVEIIDLSYRAAVL